MSLVTPRGVAIIHNSNHLEDVVTISFATALWTYVERGFFDDFGLDKLHVYCDIATKKLKVILKNRASDEGLMSLFKYNPETV